LFGDTEHHVLISTISRLIAPCQPGMVGQSFAMAEHTLTGDRYRVHSVERAFLLLEELAEAGSEGLTLSDLSRRRGVSKSAAYAILQTLLSLGFVADSGAGLTRRYRLGMALARLGDVVVSQIGLRDVALPVLRDMTAVTGLTSRAVVLDEPFGVVIGRVEAPNSTVRFAANLGKREHLHCSAVGKAMLAALPAETVRGILAEVGLPSITPRTITDEQTLLEELRQVGARGYAVDDEEDIEGVVCVGAAVVDHASQCVGAISVTGLKSELPAWRVDQVGLTVREHAGRISSKLAAPFAAAELQA
jgi:IclR family acetate operon transcriptional repressor